eukprot:jgi/Mesen1/9889/ME000070S09180
MKVVSYNVNGLRARVQQHRTLKNLLDALDADIICLQETKISRAELTADLVLAEGYETFLSCTRGSRRGRVGYSGGGPRPQSSGSLPLSLPLDLFFPLSVLLLTSLLPACACLALSLLTVLSSLLPTPPSS